MRVLHKREIEVEYPESDGEPMAETDVHWDWMVTINLRLKRFYRGRRVYVAGNLFIYHIEGDPKKSVAPDTFVVKNCVQKRRRIFQIWKEKRTPCFILETTSKKTRAADRGSKKLLYAELGVKEYFLYDPLAEWLKPPLQGFRLHNMQYDAIVPDANGSLLSEELGIRFMLEDRDLVMIDARTGKRVLSGEEIADPETIRADEAERQVRELREEIARYRDAAKKTNGHRTKNGK